VRSSTMCRRGLDMFPALGQDVSGARICLRRRSANQSGSAFLSGGGAIVRTVVALWLLSTALLYWLGDFNTYADIGGREYVIARPDPLRRLAYCAGLRAACGIAVRAPGPPRGPDPAAPPWPL